MSEQKTVRDLIVEMQTEAKSDNFSPADAANVQRKLAALLGNVNREIRVREMAYKRLRLQCYQSEGKANRAKMIAEASPEFEAWEAARHGKEELIELKRSLKVFIEDAHEERRYSGNM